MRADTPSGPYSHPTPTVHCLHLSLRLSRQMPIDNFKHRILQPTADCLLLTAYFLSVRASTPGSFSPDRNSSVAPPPVETCVILSPTPAKWTAAAESPPPTIETAEEAATARATASVPSANCGISKTPIGPFQTMVFESAMTAAY